MPSSTLTTATPIPGAAYDPAIPDTRQPWLDQRRGGITATEIRDWANGADRRAIITGKVTGIYPDLSSIKAIRHGHDREPAIAAFIADRFGMTHTNAVYAHPDNPRHLASPDAIDRDPFTGRLVAGPEARIAEIKTSTDDLTPGVINAQGVLVGVGPGSAFDRTGYYRQVQWQMYVMNAALCLFVWEQHQHYRPVAEPGWCWIRRDEAMIAQLIAEADEALAEIDAARLANVATDLPEASDLPAEHAMIVADLLTARDAVAVAEAARDAAFSKLKALYITGDNPDVSIDAGFARLTVSTTRRDKLVVDRVAMATKAPTLTRKFAELEARHTHREPVTTTKLTVTRKKETD